MDQEGRGSGSGSRVREPSRMVGAALGQYTIEALLGAGGMGEVWRAQDTRLGRQVALKMLPEEVAQDPDRMARFTREARVLASLSHPNVAVLYGLEDLPLSLPPGSDAAGADSERSVHLLVMELVEGEGLDEVIERGPLPFREAMSIALQIAEGLQAAHERNVVHRDLKPANIKVRPDGTVKVLDFGLATTRFEPWSKDSESKFATMTQHHTALGAVVGTAAYMSPEQARGKPVDRRADVWAFGCLLFEMLSGTKAFGGESYSDVTAAILRDDPDWNALPADLEPVVRHVLRRCLAKDPARRFHDIADVRIELEEGFAVAKPRRTAVVRGRRSVLPWLAGIVALAVGGGAVSLLAGRGAPGAPLPTFQALSFHNGRAAGARFGPDGKTVVFGASTRERPLALLSTRIDSVESRPLDLPSADILGIARTGQMAILLDRRCEGSWVSVGTLAAADLAGGAPRSILERVNDGDIAPDGRSMAVAREVGRFQRLEYPLGRQLFETQGWISNVRIAPDSRRVAFLHHPFYGDDRGLVVMIDADGKVVELTEEQPDSVQGLAWSPDGEEVWYSAFVFGQGGVVWSVRPGERPVERLRAPISLRLRDIGADGKALIVAGDSRAEIAGKLAGHTGEKHFEGWNDDSIGGLAADGSMFAGNTQVATVDGEYAAFAQRGDGGPAVRLGYGSVFGMTPTGTWVFARPMTGERRRLELLATGPGESQVVDLGDVRPDDSAAASLSCSLDGRRAAFTGFEGDGGPRTYILDVKSRSLQAVGPEGATAPVISPDGLRVAALGPDGGVIVVPIAGGEPQPVAAVEQGERPLQWSRDGRALLVWDQAFPARIVRVGLADGRRDEVLKIMPENPAGVLYGRILMAPGGDAYVYRYRRDVSTLYLVAPSPGR